MESDRAFFHSMEGVNKLVQFPGNKCRPLFNALQCRSIGLRSNSISILTSVDIRGVNPGVGVATPQILGCGDRGVVGGSGRVSEKV